MSVRQDETKQWRTLISVKRQKYFANNGNDMNCKKRCEIPRNVCTRVAFHGGSSHFFGIGIYPLSDTAGIGIFWSVL